MDIAISIQLIFVGYPTTNGRTDTANEELQQLIQILEKDSSEGRMRQASGDEYPNGSSVHHSPGTTDMYGGYRNQPEIVDESSMLPYNGMLPLLYSCSVLILSHTLL